MKSRFTEPKPKYIKPVRKYPVLNEKEALYITDYKLNGEINLKIIKLDEQTTSVLMYWQDELNKMFSCFTKETQEILASGYGLISLI